jgi:para-aminobenzoate synthetase component 1
LNDLAAFQNAHKTWLFGYLSYDLKNEIEDLSSQDDDVLALPLAQFVEPQLLIKIIGHSMQIIVIAENIHVQSIANDILSENASINETLIACEIAHKTSQNDYVKVI